ncbi:nucleocapsid protein [Pararge aegeria rhabdovirus]|uniref:Nucleoprotein n=35 Tax=root TaxID=1 RepID=A0A140D8P8_9RHAB|nr:nucleocapsid protein [Pararge aegeria rhabdovirus]AMK09272.1 nucleocapsid protein [Pararge aegeria rhabdovirus]QMP82221.1 nucleocapsid protein [Lepidopteran rhabdo-related virus OKIAV12]
MMNPQLKRTASIHIATKKAAKFEYVDTDALVDYPSDWFTNHPNSKPPVTVPKTNCSKDDLYKAARGGIRAMNLSISTAKLVLHVYGKEMTDSCDEDWTSFSVKIGTKGASITPWDLVTVTEGTVYQPVEATGGTVLSTPSQPQMDISTWTPRALVLYILCIYRLLRITNQEYVTLLITKMEQQLTAEGGSGMKLSGATLVYAGWISDRNYLKLVAAYDMFLYHFSGHEDGILRLGSLGSRFRDCAGLLSYGYAMSILDIEAGYLMDWIFVKTMGDEMIRMTREGQETGSPTSYFPYQSDLHLVNRSAYSSNANSYLFHWIHTFGSLMSHKRSINARYNFEGNVADVGLNAVVLCWAFARGGELNPQFQKEGLDYGKNIEPVSSGMDDDENQGPNELTPEDKMWLDTTGRDPATWFALLKANGFKVPPVVSRVIKRQRGRIGETRIDSIGEYVKERLIY